MYPEMIDLTGQVAVVTGAARNIGFTSATALGEAGATIVITDIDDAGGISAVDKLNTAGIKAVYHHMNVVDSTEVAAVAKAVHSEFGRIDILVANAGIVTNTAAEDMGDDEWLKVVDVNLNGVFYCDREFGRYMLDSDNGGRIVNIGSIAGEICPNPQKQAHYNASKAAVHMLTKSLAYEWCNRGVRVNAVAPTYIKTDLTDDLIAAEPELVDRWLSLTPLGRMGLPTEIASVVLFLASDLSKLMHGSIVKADAAYTCW